MSNYANQVIFVLNPNGIECVFITARADRRNEKQLVAEINQKNYFGEGFSFVRQFFQEENLTQEQAELGRKTLLAYYEAMGRTVLNVKDLPLKLVA